jgi:two-component system OmpR family response regulator
MVTVAARDGLHALRTFRSEAPSLMVLDIGMPEMDGLEVCRQVRKTSDVPILFLSARDEEVDRILGLEIGGDDYVTKPFSPRELVARVGVILKRARGPEQRPAAEATALSKGALSLDPQRHVAEFEGRDVALTATEFAIVLKLLARREAVLSREQIMRAAYGANIHVSDRTIDSHVRNIRSKFAARGCESAIETVHGVGFRLGRCEARG